MNFYINIYEALVVRTHILRCEVHTYSTLFYTPGYTYTATLSYTSTTTLPRTPPTHLNTANYHITLLLLLSYTPGYTYTPNLYPTLPFLLHTIIHIKPTHPLSILHSTQTLHTLYSTLLLLTIIHTNQHTHSLSYTPQSSTT